MAIPQENRRVEQSAHRIAPAELSDPALVALWRLWRENRPKEGLPPRGSIDPIRFPRLLPNVFIIQVTGDLPVFTYSLVGEENIEAHGSNFKGMDVRDLDSHWPGYGASLHEFYSFVVAGREAVAARGAMNFIDKGFRRFETIYLPLAGCDGNVSQILGAACYSLKPIPA